MAEDVEMLMARAMCSWHHDHRGGATPCRQATLEAAAVLGYLASHDHHVVPNSLRMTIDGDDIKVWINDLLIFEGKRKMLAWDDPDAKPGETVRDVMRSLWESAQDEDVQEYVINGVPAHEAVHMTLDELKTPPGLREDAFRREREGYWNDVAELRKADSRLLDLLQRSIMPWSGEPITKPAHWTKETIQRTWDDINHYRVPIGLPEHMQVQVVPPNPRSWAAQHVADHPTHVVLVAGPADIDTQCFYPTDCKATMWTDTGYDRYQRTMAGFKWEVEHNIYRHGTDHSEHPGE